MFGNYLTLMNKKRGLFCFAFTALKNPGNLPSSSAKYIPKVARRQKADIHAIKLVRPSSNNSKENPRQK